MTSEPPNSDSGSEVTGDSAVRTFLIADIRGYTRFTQEHGDEAAARLASTFAEVVEGAVSAHGGALIELRGDEALVVFASARQALRAAVEIQRRCRTADERGSGLPLGVGIGLDTGEAVPLPGGGYRGGALNLAARLCSLARPGEILVSEGVIHLARRVEGLRYIPRRRERLKGIAERVRVVSVEPEKPLPPVPTRAPARHRLSPRVIATSGLVSLAILGAVLGLLLVQPGGTTRTRLVPDSAGLFGPDGQLMGSVTIAGRPSAVAVGGGAVWITDAVNNTLLRVDPRRKLVVDRIRVGANPTGVTIGAGSIWVANSDDGTVSQVNPGNDSVVATIRVGNGPTSIAYGAGRVWVLDVVDATVTAIAPASGRTTAIPLGQNPTRLTFGLGSVWVTSEEAGILLRLDPGTRSVVQAIPVGNAPVGVAAGDGAIWVANVPDRTVSRIDPASGTVAKIVLPARPVELAVADGQVWTSNTLDGTVSVINARSRRVMSELATRQAPAALAASGDAVWALALASAASHRGGTLRVVSEGGDTFDSIDPGTAFRVASWQLLSFVYDGLLTYRRVAGPGGQDVVPDLAAALPLIENGGRRYVFRLRDGLRYSNGQPVKASDIRTSLEREYRAGDGLSLVLPTIIGANRCSKRACDLSQGVVTDDRAGTVTFNLSSPDPDFLFKLALPWGDVVPKGTPPIGATKGVLPATGPYQIVSFVPNHSLVLTRNPEFHPWSPDAQPPGYPDRIIYRFGLAPSEETNAVEQGRADVMVDSPPPSRLREIVTRFPSQAHLFVEPTVFYLFLNTRIPPFEDVRVRRALNFATDRAKLVRLWGDPLLARPTCQVLPPGIAGYRPYCPYTGGASAAGGWSAPDLGRARALLAAAGGAHGPVSVLVNGDDHQRVDVARYFVALLNRLGYRARLRRFANLQTFYQAAGRPSTHAQAGVSGWESNFPRASDFFPNLLSCPAYQPAAPVNLNSSAFCMPAIDQQAAHARALATSDPAASAALWSRVDREVTDAAPWVAFLNRAGIDLTSSRVGNYERNPQFSLLLDQLWVH